MKKVHIALIDDGISRKEINCKLKHNLIVDEQMHIRENTEFDKSFHGIMCAKIILDYLKTETDLSSIKILNEKGISDIDKLLAALKNAEEIGANIINLSLGSTTFKDREKLLPIVNLLASKGIIIVCAVNNLLYHTYPASFTNVISVCSDREDELKQGEFEVLDTNSSNIFIKAFARHTIELTDGQTKQLYPSNSYAAPMITAIIANNYNQWLKKGAVHIEHIKKCLNDISKNKKQYTPNYPHPDWIQNAIYVNIKAENPNQFDFRYFKDNLNFSKFKFETEKAFMEFIQDYIKKDDTIVDTLILDAGTKLKETTVKKTQKIIKEKITSIIYIDEHNLQYNLQAAKDGFRVWNITDILKYQTLKKTNQNAKEISIPLIVIKLENTSNFLSYDIETFFESRGYNCQIYSDDKYKLLLDSEYIDTDKIPFDNLIYKSNEIIDTRKIDLAIMEFENTSFFETYSKIADIVIDIYKDKLNIKYEKTKEEFLINHGKIDIEKLMQSLYLILS